MAVGEAMIPTELELSAYIDRIAIAVGLANGDGLLSAHDDKMLAALRALLTAPTDHERWEMLELVASEVYRCDEILKHEPNEAEHHYALWRKSVLVNIQYALIAAPSLKARADALAEAVEMFIDKATQVERGLYDVKDERVDAMSEALAAYRASKGE
jgi:hypothetical protein